MTKQSFLCAIDLNQVFKFLFPLLRLSPPTGPPSTSWWRPSRPTSTSAPTRSKSTGAAPPWATSPRPRSTSSRRPRLRRWPPRPDLSVLDVLLQYPCLWLGYVWNKTLHKNAVMLCFLLEYRYQLDSEFVVSI